MEHKALAARLKLILIGTGIGGLVVFFLLLPESGRTIAAEYPEFAGRFWPWLGFLWAAGIPCYIALALGWKIAANIGADASFTRETAGYLQRISLLAAGDAVFFFAGNGVLLFADMSHPGVTLLSLLVVFAGVAVSVAAAAAARLVEKAAILQEQNDLTI